jgi:hypothetical protein
MGTGSPFPEWKRRMVFDPRQGQSIFLLATVRTNSRPTQPPIQWVPGVLFPRGNGDWDSIPDRGKNFSYSLCVQTSYKALPASYPLGVVGPFPGVNRDRGVKLTTHLHLCGGQEWLGAVGPLPLVLNGGSGTALLWLIGFFKLFIAISCLD